MTVLRLHIDRLVLKGVPAHERDSFVRHFQQALQQRLLDAAQAPDSVQAWQALPDRARLNPPPLAVVAPDAGLSGYARQAAGALVQAVLTQGAPGGRGAP